VPLRAQCFENIGSLTVKPETNLDAPREFFAAIFTVYEVPATRPWKAHVYPEVVQVTSALPGAEATSVNVTGSPPSSAGVYCAQVGLVVVETSAALVSVGATGMVVGVAEDQAEKRPTFVAAL
jgi:hypothetical protein